MYGQTDTDRIGKTLLHCACTGIVMRGKSGPDFQIFTLLFCQMAYMLALLVEITCIQCILSGVDNEMIEIAH